MRLRLTVLAASPATVTEDDPQPQEEPAEAAKINTQLGGEYLKQGKPELAREKLEKAIEQDPQSADAHTYLALAYDELGDVEKAEKHYERALRLEPGVATTLNLYGALPARTREGCGALLRAGREGQALHRGVCVRRFRCAAAEAYFRQALDATAFQDALGR